MKAAFIHDHRFPRYNEEYYSSSGFENSFLQRYLDIFDQLKIIARDECVVPDINSIKLATNNVEYFTIHSTKSLFCHRVYKLFCKELSECDVAIIRMPSILGLFAGKACKAKEIPFLVEVVGCPWDSMSFKGIIFDALGRIYASLMKRMVKNAPYVVYVSESFLEKRYPTKGRFTNISNILLDNYGECDTDKRKHKIINYNPIEGMLIGSCGSLSAEYKSQEDVIKIIPKLVEKGINVKYQLVGGGLPDRLINCAKKYEVMDRVEIIGELKHEDVFLWLDELDIYVHPSKQEGLCRAIIEAMSRACPIVAADAGGVHEQINDDYVFPKGDLDKLLSLILEYNIENMLKEAEYNYNNAAKYQSAILNQRRQMFFKEFIDNSFLGRK